MFPDLGVQMGVAQDQVDIARNVFTAEGNKSKSARSTATTQALFVSLNGYLLAETATLLPTDIGDCACS